jgi:hypothetical protein
MAIAGAGMEVAASRLIEQRLGLVAEAYETGRAHRLRTWSEALTVGGAAGAVFGRHRTLLAASGVALLAGSALQRFGVFEAGVASTQDPKYVVVPQRERLDAAHPVQGDDRGEAASFRLIALVGAGRSAVARVLGAQRSSR